MIISTKSQFKFLTISLCALAACSCSTKPEITPPKSNSLSETNSKTVAINELKGNKRIRILDRDAQPLVRIPPQIPTNAKTSGHCKMRFDVAPSKQFFGTPSNIEVLSCSKKLFERNAINSVKRWKFTSEIIDGRYTGYKGVESTVWFKLKGLDGNLIPE